MKLIVSCVIASAVASCAVDPETTPTSTLEAVDEVGTIDQVRVEDDGTLTLLRGDEIAGSALLEEAPAAISAYSSCRSYSSWASGSSCSTCYQYANGAAVDDCWDWVTDSWICSQGQSSCSAGTLWTSCSVTWCLRSTEDQFELMMIEQ